MSDFPLPVVAVSGTPTECGAAYGCAAQPLIAANTSAYLRRFRLAADLSPARVRAEGARFRDMTRQLHPRIAGMLDGVAEGAGVAVEEIYAVNARTELLYGTYPATPNECTAIGLAGSRTLLGQNWDWHPEQRPYTLLLVTTDENGFTIMSMVEAGMLAKTGLNSAGLGLCVNLLSSDRDGGNGVPYHVLLRAALETDTLSRALEALCTSPRSSSINIMIGQAHDGPGGGEIIDVELVPGDVGFLHPDNAGRLTHANHLESGIAVRDGNKTRGGSSFFRAARARRLLATGLTPMEIFRDHAGYPTAICRHVDERLPDLDRSETLFSVLLDLDERRMAVAAGPPCTSAYSWLDLTGVPAAATAGQPA
jgi:isopenicillin-N N-acyltransferase-like protein